MRLAWFAGVDWGSQKHQACVLDAAGKLLGEREFEHGGAGLSQMADWLLSFAAGDESAVGVAVETPSGPVVESLMERGFVVHSINPKQLDRFRDRMSPAGAKDDRRDARVLASALRTDPHCLRQLEPTDPAIIELREWSRLDEDLTRERVRLGNRMRQQLWRYYPQFLDAVGDDVAAPWVLDLWRRLPTPRAAQRVREMTLTRVLKQHRIRRISASTLRDRLRAPAVKLAPGAAEAAVAHARLVAERLALVNRQLDQARRELRPVGGSARRRCPSGRPGRVDGRRAIVAGAPGCGHPVVAAGHRHQGAGGAACRGWRCGQAAGLRCPSLPLRGGSCHPPFGEEHDRDPAARSPRPAARRRLSLGPRRRPPRPGQPRQSTSRSGLAVTATHARCARWRTACSASPAPCCAPAPASTRTVSAVRLDEPLLKPQLPASADRLPAVHRAP